MKLYLISRYRTEIMGFSILLIILYHSTQINFGDTFYSHLFNFIKAVSYGGVDLFFFLSGFGLVCGWLRKTYRISVFYKRRLFRILPTYWTALFIYLIIHLTYFNDFKLKGFIGDLLGLGFLTSTSYNYWFIPSIIICYLIFPYIIFLLEKGFIKQKLLSNFWSLLLICSSLPLLLCLIASLTNKYQLLIFFTRLPNFILGVVIGFLYSQKKLEASKDIDLNFYAITFLFLFGYLCLFYTNYLIDLEFSWRYGLLWYPFIFLTFPLCLILSSLFDCLDNKLFLLFYLPKKCLIFCGQYSLEIYLFHILVFDFYIGLSSLIDSSNISSISIFNKSNILTYLILTALSLLLAFFINKLISFLIQTAIKLST